MALAQMESHRRLWEKEINMHEELPKTAQSCEKGGPPPLVKVKGSAFPIARDKHTDRPLYPDGRDLRREMHPLGDDDAEGGGGGGGGLSLIHI